LYPGPLSRIKKKKKKKKKKNFYCKQLSVYLMVISQVCTFYYSSFPILSSSTSIMCLNAQYSIYIAPKLSSFRRFHSFLNSRIYFYSKCVASTVIPYAHSSEHWPLNPEGPWLLFTATSKFINSHFSHLLTSYKKPLSGYFLNVLNITQYLFHLNFSPHFPSPVPKDHTPITFSHGWTKYLSSCPSCAFWWRTSSWKRRLLAPGRCQALPRESPLESRCCLAVGEGHPTLVEKWCLG